VACPIDPRTGVSQTIDAISQLRVTEVWGEKGALEGLVDKGVLRGVRVVRVTGAGLGVPVLEELGVGGNGDSSLSSSTSTSSTSTSSTSANSSVQGQAECLVLRTSGTTGVPKVVPITPDQLRFNVRQIAESLRLTRSDLCLNAMPLFHIGGLTCSLLASLSVGAHVILMRSFDPSLFLEQLEGRSVTWYYAAPTIHKALLLEARALGRPLATPSLRLVRSGAAHLPHADALELKRVFPAAVIMPTYSMSECMPVCSVGPDYALDNPDSVGAAIGPELRIGADGEVQLRGPGVFAGYDRHEAARYPGRPGDEFTPDGWFKTGDLGHVDERGALHLHGRSKEVAKRGGEQVSLFEVDDAVRLHPGVDVAVSFSVPNPFWGEEIAVAVILAKPAATAPPAVTFESLRALFRARGIEDFKVPRQVLVLEDDKRLPKTSSGKYQRRLFAEALGVKPVDLPVQVAQQPATSLLDRPSKALMGLRFFMSLWVAQRHVGVFPNKGWNVIRDVSINMVVFFLLAGMMMSTSATRAIAKGERRAFYAARLGAMQPTLLVATLFALPAYFAYDHNFANVRAVGLVWSLFGYFTGLFVNYASVVFIGPAWFQTALYWHIFAFPFLDKWLRGVRRQGILVGIMGACCTITAIIPLTWSTPASWVIGYTMPLGWLSVYTAGIILACHFRLNQGQRLPPAVWGVITDTITALWVVMLWLGTLDGKTKGKDSDYRYNSVASIVMGDLRNAIWVAAPWVYGLGLGHGLTARFLQLPFIVRHLAPLAYPLYLFHLPVAYYLYYGRHRGLGTSDTNYWLPQQGLWPVDLPWWFLFICIAVSLVLGWLHNNFLNPRIVPYTTKFYRFVFRVSSAVSPSTENGVLEVVQALILKLSGAEAARESRLDQVGLDSLGATAIVGALRNTFPEACTELRPLDIYKLATVGDLVAWIEAKKGSEH
jgi:acyl-CoA synthetase (AMP-forming)/AMP-acid ligase II/acyl carrier protein